MVNENTDPSAILSSLSPEAREAVEAHVRQQLISQLGGEAAAPAPTTPRRGRPAGTANASAPRGRRGGSVTTSEGEEFKSISDFIRSYDPESSPASVVANAAELGVTVAASQVSSIFKKERELANMSDRQRAKLEKEKKEAARARAEHARNSKKKAKKSKSRK